MRRNTSRAPVCTILFIFLLGACGKEVKEAKPPTPATPVVVIPPVVMPPVASSIGFFLNDWAAKTFSPPSFKDTTPPAAAALTVTVDPIAVITKIPRAIAGNNANLWMTQMVTEPTLLAHIQNLHPHIIRFPGGSISDVFFWNARKDVPPADAPAQLVKADGTKEAAGFWYGQNNEGWTLSVDNYYKMLQQTGNSGMITVNYGYARYSTAADPVAAAAHLAADWVRYDKGRTQYWEVGNENFGEWEAGYRIDVTKNKDSQPEIITGETYGRHFKVFADSMRKAAQEVGATIQIGAVMVEAGPQSWESLARKTWNNGLMSNAGSTPDFYIIHNYYTPYKTNAAATDILGTAITETKKVMDYAQQTLRTGGVSEKPIALTEWNITSEGAMQQVSHINGMHAVLLLGEALKNKYGMTARWDFANGWDGGNDHGLFSQGNAGGGEPGVPFWNPRPAFYHLYYFQKFLGDLFITSSIANTMAVESYASSFSSGEVSVTLVNKSTAAQNVQIDIKHFNVGNRYYWYTLSGGNDNGEFSRKVLVNGQGPAGAGGGTADYATIKSYAATTSNGIKVTVPARSVVYLVVDKK